MKATGKLTVYANRLFDHILPQVPENLRDSLLENQFKSASDAYQMLWLVGIFYTVAIVTVAWHDTMSLYHLVLPVFGMVCCYRMIMDWKRRPEGATTQSEMRVILKQGSVTSFLLVSVASA